MANGDGKSGGMIAALGASHAPSARPPRSESALSSAELLALLRAAQLAPTPNNTQPFRYRVGEEDLEVWLDESRLVRGLDFRGVSEWLSVGALFENMSLEALGLGLELGLSVSRELSFDAPLARITWRRGRTRPAALAGQIPLRRSNRFSFSPEPVAEEHLLALQAEALWGSRVALTCDRQRIGEVAQVVGMADTVRAGNAQAHVDLHRWLRHSPEEARRTGDGLDVALLGVGGLKRVLLRLTSPWWLMRILAALGLTRVMGRVGYAQATACGALGAITSTDLTADAIAEGGRTLERVWLRATQLGLSLSPLGVLPMLLLKVEHTPEQLPAGVVRAMLPLVPRVHAALGVPTGHHLVGLVRVGQAAHTPPTSERRRLTELVSGAPEALLAPPAGDEIGPASRRSGGA